MGKKQYSSAADRRFQQRFQRIQERRDMNIDVEDSRKQRRRQKNTLYKCGNLDIDRLINSKIAVQCASELQAKQIFLKINQRYPDLTRWMTFDTVHSAWITFYELSTIAVVTEESWFGTYTNVTIRTRGDLARLGYEIVDFCELLPVKDLGKVHESNESIGFLLGI